MQTKALMEYVNVQENYIEEHKTSKSPQEIYKLMGLSRIEPISPYLDDLLNNMDTNTSNKNSILSSNDKNFQGMSKTFENVNLTYERYIIEKSVDIYLKNFKLHFHYLFAPTTFNDEIIFFYRNIILPFYLLNTLVYNTFDNIKEVLNAGKLNMLER